MNITTMLSAERVYCGARATSKKRALQVLAELLCGGASEAQTRTVFENLIARERLGSTGLGKGVALPHARLPELDAPIAALASFSAPIDFDAIDRQPVDLMLALLVPEQSTDEHLQILAGLAEMFSDQSLCQQLRRSTTAEEMHRLSTHWTPGGSTL